MTLARLAYYVTVVSTIELPADSALARGLVCADVTVHSVIILALTRLPLQLRRQGLGGGYRQLAGVVLADVGRGLAVDHAAGFQQG